MTDEGRKTKVEGRKSKEPRVHPRPSQDGPSAARLLESTFRAFREARDSLRPEMELREIGTVLSAEDGVAFVRGLPSVGYEEGVVFSNGTFGLAFDLERDRVGVALLDPDPEIKAGDEVRRSGNVLSVTVGKELLGRVIDPTGRPLDGLPRLRSLESRPLESEAPPIVRRLPVTRPLLTGLKVIDTLVPIGRGQRELILGDRQTGKTTVAVDTILNQRGQNVFCIYCAIGQRRSVVAESLEALKRHGALDYTTLVVASGDDPPGLQYLAPYSATAIGEHIMEQGEDVLVVYDDLTQHARAYRELSLLMRRPPGREAFPGDIFYIHARLLERSTCLKKEYGGGSLTALPIVETEAQNISTYIPTNLISITDGQIYLSPRLFQKGELPAIDVGMSVSRVGGKTQLPAYRLVSGSLRRFYSQFEELEAFARFAAKLEPETRKTLERGRRVREALKQARRTRASPAEQVALFLAVIEGFMDEVPLSELHRAEEAVYRAVGRELLPIREKIEQGAELETAERERILEVARREIGKR